MWNKCVIAVKGICNAAPWSQTDLPAPSMETLDIPSFSHMDMILQVDAKVDLKERENPDRLICFCSQTQIN